MSRERLFLLSSVPGNEPSGNECWVCSLMLLWTLALCVWTLLSLLWTLALCVGTLLSLLWTLAWLL